MGMSREKHMDPKYFCHWLKLFSLLRKLPGNQLYSSFLFVKLAQLFQCRLVLICSNCSHFHKEANYSKQISLIQLLANRYPGQVTVVIVGGVEGERGDSIQIHKICYCSSFNGNIFIMILSSDVQPFSSLGTHQLIPKILQHTTKYIRCQPDKKYV